MTALIQKPGPGGARSRPMQTEDALDQRLRLEFWRDALELSEQELARFDRSIRLGPDDDVGVDLPSGVARSALLARNHA